MSHFQPIGAAAVLQVTDINKDAYIQNYQSVMSLLVTDVTYLDWWDGELVVKDSAAFDSHSSSASSCVFKRPYGLEEVPMLNASMNYAFDHGCNWNDGDVPYSEVETVLHCEAPSAVAVYCFGPQKTNFISGLIDLQLLISLSYDALNSLTYVCQPTDARLYVTASLDMFVHCGELIH